MPRLLEFDHQELRPKLPTGGAVPTGGVAQRLTFCVVLCLLAACLDRPGPGAATVRADESARKSQPKRDADRPLDGPLTFVSRIELAPKPTRPEFAGLRFWGASADGTRLLFSRWPEKIDFFRSCPISELVVLNTADFSQRCAVTLDADPRQLMFSRDARHVVVVESDFRRKRLQLVDLEKQAVAGVWNGLNTRDVNFMIPTGEWIGALEIAPDLKTVFLGSENLEVIDIASGQQTTVFAGKKKWSWVPKIAFSQEPNRVAFMVTSDFYVAQVMLWEPESGKMPEKLFDLKSEDRIGCYELVLSPDGRYIACRATIGEIDIWEVQTRKQIATFYTRDDSPVRSVEFAADSRRAVVRGRASQADGRDSLLVFDLKNRRTTCRIAALESQHDFDGSWALFPDGSRVAVSDGHRHRLRVIDLETERAELDIAAHRASNLAVVPHAIDPNRKGEMILADRWRSWSAIDAATGRTIAQSTRYFYPEWLRFAGTQLYASCDEGTAVCDVAAGSVVNWYPTEHFVQNHTFLNGHIAHLHYDHRLRRTELRDRVTRERLLTLDGLDVEPTPLRFEASNNGATVGLVRVAFYDKDGIKTERRESLNFWDTQTGRHHRVDGIDHTWSVFSPVGTHWIYASTDDLGDERSVHRVDIRTNDNRVLFKIHTTESHFVVAVSPDEKLLVTCDSTYNYVWNCADGTLIAQLKPFEDSRASHGAFSADGRHLALHDLEGGVFIWRVADQSTLHFIRKPDRCRSVAFSEDGGLLACGDSSDCSVWIYRVAEPAGKPDERPRRSARAGK